jgi:hypothetical protein
MLIFAALSVTAFATDGGAPETVFTRITEFATLHKQEILECASAAAMITTSIAIGVKNAKKSEKISKAVSNVKSDTDASLNGQTGVVKAVNGLIDGYNGMTRDTEKLKEELSVDYKKLAEEYEAMRKAYERYGETENDRNRVTAAVLVQNAAMLEILQLVYANSKNMPQGVKDMVNLKYANCLKTLADDEKVLAVVDSVREQLNENAEGVELV